jgi:hypothetical protein
MFLCPLLLLGFLKKIKHFWKILSLKDSLGEKLQVISSSTSPSALAIERRSRRLEHNSAQVQKNKDWAHMHSIALAIESSTDVLYHTSIQAWVHQCSSAKEPQLSTYVHSSALTWDQAHSSALMRQKSFFTLDWVFNLLAGLVDWPTALLWFLRLLGFS